MDTSNCVSPAYCCKLSHLRARLVRRYFASRYDIDFVALTYTRDGADVREARRAMHDAGLVETKVLAKVRASGAIHADLKSQTGA